MTMHFVSSLENVLKVSLWGSFFAYNFILNKDKKSKRYPWLQA